MIINPQSAKRRTAKIGQILLESSVINEDQLRIALQEQNAKYRPFGKLLVELGFISESALSEALSKSLETQAVDLDAVIPDPDALALVPYEVAKQHNLLPLSYDSDNYVLTIATADPRNILAFDQIRTLLLEGTQIETLLAGESEIALAIDQYYSHRLSIDGILSEIEGKESDQTNPQQDHSQPASRLLLSLISDAVKQAVSDIHFEPEPGFLRIRYRLNGLLRQVRLFHISYWPTILVRIKLLAKLDIVETNLPQSGRFSLTVSGRAIDFRTSSLPSSYGENVVIRILDRHRAIAALKHLDLTDHQLPALTQLIRNPEGLVLFVGPGSCGKTTTMYSVLEHLNNESVNVMTLEDPIEYPMPMIRQSTVRPNAPFEDMLRAILRQNPNILAIGQIDNKKIAMHTFHTALSGMLVLSTLNASSVFHALQKLRDLDIGADTISSGLIGIVGQRLIQKLCANCRLEEPLDLEKFGHLIAPSITAPKLFSANGCHECDFTGYRGQLLVVEILKITPQIATLIHQKKTVHQIAAMAKKQGFRPLPEAGLEKMFEGKTSVAEFVRVCGYNALFASDQEPS